MLVCLIWSDYILLENIRACFESNEFFLTKSHGIEYSSFTGKCGQIIFINAHNTGHDESFRIVRREQSEEINDDRLGMKRCSKEEAEK
jgi:hypothetical protein